ncbi:MAG: ATP phosphoribosyltransferase regulatory subunit [Oscillospiraceae bacterium]|nr:ATP phosphoribosyltransferase regulatory subunit [Oscillospiraceae bacterium]
MMQNFMNILNRSELIEFALRDIYEKAGFSAVRPVKFERAELYIDNKNFVGSGGIITFMDTDGQLLSLKPDVTLSVVKKALSAGGCQKLYYSDEVCRMSPVSRKYEAIRQIGLEHIGDIDRQSTEEIITLALKSLKTISDDYILDISHVGFISDLFKGLEKPLRDAVFENVILKSRHGITGVLENAEIADSLKEKLLILPGLHGKFSDILPQAEKLVISAEMENILTDLKALYNYLVNAGLSKTARLDFGIINDLSYYSGIIFRGYVKELSSVVLSGGRYDNLVRKLGGTGGAMGFAVKLNEIEERV